MKTVLACLMLVAAAQAVDWANIRPMVKVRPSILPHLPKTNNGRIIGGTLATEGQFKYQVGVFVDETHFCGGSLISDTVVLTAAHCVQGYRTWDVHCGALNIRNEDEPGRVVVRSTFPVVHDGYNANYFWHDIAVIYLPNAVSGPNIGTVRLPSFSMANNLFVGETCRVSGWGLISDNAVGINDDMRWVDLTVITNTECANYYGDNSIRDGVVCVGTNNGAVSPCSGDSGGPLVWTEADGEVTQIGIVSFGSSAGCESGAPAAFARVTYYLAWIEFIADISIRP